MPCNPAWRHRALHLVAALAAAASVLTAVPSARAITNGTPDGDDHPYVGLVTDGYSVCSGAALSPTLFVTAAHCFDDPGGDVWVTVDPAGFDSVPVTGSWHPDPNSCFGCVAGLPGVADRDVAVVVLDTPLSLRRYAALPSQRMHRPTGRRERLTVVGYGVQNFRTGGGPPQVGDVFTRYTASVEIVHDGSLDDRFLKLSANPAQGKGGVCFGDSGGPLLAGDVILGITSFVTNQLCRGVTYSYRTEQSDVIRFVNSFR